MLPALHRLHLTLAREKQYSIKFQDSLHKNFKIIGTDNEGEVEDINTGEVELGIPMRSIVFNPTHSVAEPLVLIITPTRELTEQIAENARLYSKYIDNVRVLEIFGGVNEKAQVDMCRLGIDVLISTPGRLLTLLQSGKIFYFIIFLFVDYF